MATVVTQHNEPRSHVVSTTLPSVRPVAGPANVADGKDGHDPLLPCLVRETGQETGAHGAQYNNPTENQHRH